VTDPCHEDGVIRLKILLFCTTPPVVFYELYKCESYVTWNHGVINWRRARGCRCKHLKGNTKEVIKEQPSYRNLSATASRVLQCTCPVAASRKYFLAILTVQRSSWSKTTTTMAAKYRFRMCKEKKYVFADLQKFYVRKSQIIFGPQIRKLSHLRKVCTSNKFANWLCCIIRV
jgi:hypothetical protein